jgi:3-deoxy-manno-octulosonate cytidylyltransferase (CMP-KDO synthetase)
VIIATDSEEILSHVREFGGEGVMTSPDHQTGSDRIGEVLKSLPGEIILNVQGDEPEVDPMVLDSLLEFLAGNQAFDVATLAAPFPKGVEPNDRSAVKVVTSLSGRALYFSRSLIPGRKEGAPPSDQKPLLHMGVYAYRRAALERFLALPISNLERIESLEQLRFLEHDMMVGVLVTDHVLRGIDTSADLEAFRKRKEVLGGSKSSEKDR